MGGMGFIERFRVECLRSILVNTHMIEAAYRAGAQRYFFSSSACAYNTDLQKDPQVRALKESDAYPAMAERGYGWEKLMSEMFCQEYWHERGLKTFIARFHNVYGPNGTWDGGREKAPAAICRKVIEAKDRGVMNIDIWGNGNQTRSFMYIDDCTLGIDKITHCEDLIATPINLGSSELVSINKLVSLVEDIGGVTLEREYQLDAPQGVAGRNSDNTMIQRILGWQPQTPLREGLAKTYAWIAEQYEDRKAGKRTVEYTRDTNKDTRRNVDMHTADDIRTIVGAIPYRLALAGGWIDQPFVSCLNPSPPGSMVVVSLEPDCWYMERAGMATGTRNVALHRWPDGLPDRPPAELVRELYDAENRGKAEPSGSQDMIGLIYPGISRLDYDFQHAGGVFPCHIESNCESAASPSGWRASSIFCPWRPARRVTTRWAIKNLDPRWIERLGKTGRDCYEAILRCDVRALGESMNQCMACWEAILPQTVRHPVVTTDLAGLLSHYQRRFAGAMYSGCGGGYLFVASEQPVPGTLHRNGADRRDGQKTGTQVPVTEICIVGSFDNLKSRHMRLLEEAAKLGPVHVLLLSDQLVSGTHGPAAGFPSSKSDATSCRPCVS